MAMASSTGLELPSMKTIRNGGKQASFLAAWLDVPLWDKAELVPPLLCPSFPT